MARGKGRWVAAVAAVVVIGVAVGGAVGFALGASGEAEQPEVEGPSGTANRLRVEGPPGEVACGDSFEVGVYLDDLERRASLNTAGVNYGMGAFAVRLEYDAKILRVEDESDVVLNPELGEADPDADGVLPTKMLLFGPFIDNHGGHVRYGAAWLGQDPETKLGEEGPDPVAAGEPLLLFAVTFLANNAGESAVRISEPELTDPGTQPYEGIALVGDSVTVSAGECPDLPLPPPLPVLATPWPTRTPVPTPRPSPTREPPRPVEPVPAVEGGRPDCPADWYVYNDPDAHFSICYPGGLDVQMGGAIVGETGPILYVEGGDRALAKQGAPGVFILVVSWGHHRQMSLGPDRPHTCEDMTFTLGQTAVRPLELRLGDANAVGCAAVGRGEGLGLGPEAVGAIALYVPFPAGAEVPAPGGYINVNLNYIGPGFEGVPEKAEQILRTIRVGGP